MLLTTLLLLVLTPRPSLGLSTSPSPGPGPAQLSVEIGQVGCPDRSLDVVIINPDKKRGQTYSLYTDNNFQRSEEVPPGGTLRSRLILDADGTTVITVTENGRTLASEARTAACAATPSPSPTATQSVVPPPQPSAVPTQPPTPAPSEPPQQTRQTPQQTPQSPQQAPQSPQQAPPQAPQTPRQSPQAPQTPRQSPQAPQQAPQSPQVPQRTRQSAKRLPFTGSGEILRAHAYTALAVMAGGGILVFYALLWPRGGSGDWPCPIRRTR